MKLKKILYFILIVSPVLILSCATKPPDVPICVELNPDKAYCVKIVSGAEFNIDEQNKFENKTWWEQRPTMIQMPASSWAEIKSYIIKTCKKYGQCEKEISSWDRTIENVDGALKQKE